MSQLFAELVHEQSGSRSEQGLRSAALMLHAMGHADRSWLLGRVTALQRQALELLLEELQALGMPTDWNGTRHLLSERNVRARSAAEPTAQAARDPVMSKIAEASATAVANILASEPAGLIDSVIAAGDWPWRTEVLATLQARRGAIFRAIDPCEKRDPQLLGTEHSAPATEGQKRSKLVSATLQHLAVQLSHEPAARTRKTAFGLNGRLCTIFRHSVWRKSVQHSNGA